MKIFKEYMCLVIKIRNRDEDRASGRLIEFDGKYLRPQFRSGMTALFAKDDVLYCSPVKHQPEAVV
ncbi:MAG: hypothetical protein WB392_14605 [Methanotrichaceae archaeon]